MMQEPLLIQDKKSSKLKLPSTRPRVRFQISPQRDFGFVRDGGWWTQRVYVDRQGETDANLVAFFDHIDAAVEPIIQRNGKWQMVLGGLWMFTIATLVLVGIRYHGWSDVLMLVVSISINASLLFLVVRMDLERSTRVIRQVCATQAPKGYSVTFQEVDPLTLGKSCLFPMSVQVISLRPSIVSRV